MVWNKGKKLSILHRENLSKSHIGIQSGSKHPLYGTKRSFKTKKKISNSLKGRPAWNKGKVGLYKWKKESIEKRTLSRNGYKHSELTKEKIRIANLGRKLTDAEKKRLSVIHKKSFLNGRVSWMKGLTKKTDERVKRQAEIIKKARRKQVFPIKDTKIEIKIQMFLKELGYEFFTHQYITEIEHGYQCDILIPSINLVIECDGNYWHKYPIGRDIDHIRTKELIEKGFKVLRLWEVEIKQININDFKIKIMRYNK